MIKKKEKANKSQKQETDTITVKNKIEKETGENTIKPDVVETELKEEKISEQDEKQILENKLAEMQDKYLRLSADFDNYRKRTLRERMDLIKTAGEEILISILPVVDDFERALKSINSTNELSSVKEGIDLIYNKFLDYLRQRGVRAIDSDNADFNTDIHEAVTKIPVNEDEKKGKIVETILKGYYLYEKVIRYSKVVVGE